MPKRLVPALLELHDRLAKIEQKLGIPSVPTISFEGSPEEARVAIEHLKKLGINVVGDVDFEVETDEVCISESTSSPEDPQETAGNEGEQSSHLVPSSELEKHFNTPLATMEDEYGPYVVRYRLPNGHVLVWTRKKITEYNKTGFELAVYDNNENRTRYIAEEKNTNAEER